MFYLNVFNNRDRVLGINNKAFFKFLVVAENCCHVGYMKIPIAEPPATRHGSEREKRGQKRNVSWI